MADVHSQETRSFNMSRIRSTDTKPEMIVRKFLFSNGFRYRLHSRKLPGKPDLVLTKFKTVILIHGCFWHGHEGCKYFRMPKSRVEFWENKISKNKVRDIVNRTKLSELGWKVITVWECSLKPAVRNDTLDQLVKIIRSESDDNIR